MMDNNYCENCDEEGSCIYIPKNLGKQMSVIKKCDYVSLPNGDKLSKKCATKTLIQKLKERDAELMSQQAG